MCNCPKKTVDEAIGGHAPVVCRKTGRLCGSGITPTLVDKLRPHRSNMGIRALGPQPRHSRTGVARIGLAHWPFGTAAVHSSSVSFKLYTARLRASLVLPTGCASFT